MNFGENVADLGCGKDGTDLCPGEGSNVVVNFYMVKTYPENRTLSDRHSIPLKGLCTIRFNKSEI